MREKQLKFFNIQRGGESKKIVSISIDTFFLSLVIVVLLIIFSYVLGIEKGKKIKLLPSYLKRKEANQTLTLREPKLSLEKENKSSLSTTDNKLPQREGGLQKKENKKREEQPELFKKYVIQVASYKNKSMAEKEKKLLEKKGYSVRILRKGNYLVLFVGEYTDKKEAEAQLKDLKNRYKDCFIRRL